MSAEQNTVATTAEARVHEQLTGIYTSLLNKINLVPVDQLSDISAWRGEADIAEAGASQRVTAALGVFLEQLRQSGMQKVDKLDKDRTSHGIPGGWSFPTKTSILIKRV
ncbi:hypothetical protein [Serratia liquefaciens]|uniref:hypothetical protein n=1 Tax=Serratia TaxID=613 RepID=UPI00217AA002|nr:Uncharacterised protein [Serratia quinivorans]CAI1084949.1 Uncharacterised protein [Serratia quinivorans]CAI2122664.1 Uncharacterised protein [Serratia quinivorans]CAI2489774.1 Uncharacterised protein [Serratia liquefaciens]